MIKNLFKKKEPAVLNSKQQKEVKERPSKVDVDRDARFTVINNRMFICIVIMGLITLLSVYGQHKYPHGRITKRAAIQGPISPMPWPCCAGAHQKVR